jgi:hypothetical protein
MTGMRPVPQSAVEPSYFEGYWASPDASDPMRMFYEVAPDGAVLRQVEFFRDGRSERDDIANYDGEASEFGFGTLHGASFWDSEWDDADEELWLRPVDRSQFDADWTAGRQ